MTDISSSVLASLKPHLVRIWGFDGVAQRWQVYDPSVPSESDLTTLKGGRGYWVKVKKDVTFIYGSYSYALHKGWNLIGWHIE